MLVMLQAVLGFDNLLYISLESKRAPAAQQRMVRRLGIGLAVLLRIVLLFVLVEIIDLFQGSLFTIHIDGVIHADFDLHALIVLIGVALMIWLADRVSDFLQKNRMYEVLGLFILFVVGIMLLTDGDHLAHMELFGE